MKKHLLTLCLAITALVAPSVALASTSNGLVSTPLVTQWGAGLFGVQATGSSFAGTKPACSTAPASTQWAISLGTPIGRAMWASVLQAHALGKVVYINGKGVCDAWADRETVDYVQIAD
jgi:hypothetical protein